MHSPVNREIFELSTCHASGNKFRLMLNKQHPHNYRRHIPDNYADMYRIVHTVTHGLLVYVSHLPRFQAEGFHG